tara:strand:+ start:109 stop:798 length:690 start_codon:yes stop_codon:yes gene_type:complete
MQNYASSRNLPQRPDPLKKYKPPFNYVFKYVVLGDTNTGKTCLTFRFVNNEFDEYHNITIGVEFGYKIIRVPPRNIPVKIQIWDTAGQEGFRSITRSYFRGCVCALLVYDITLRETFNNVTSWLEDLNTYSNCLVKVLIGNKTDKEDHRTVSQQEGQNLATQYGLLFFETSAKNNLNINTVFSTSANLILDEIDKKNISSTYMDNNGIKIISIPKQNSSPSGNSLRPCC